MALILLLYIFFWFLILYGPWRVKRLQEQVDHNDEFSVILFCWSLQIQCTWGQMVHLSKRNFILGILRNIIIVCAKEKKNKDVLYSKQMQIQFFQTNLHRI